MTSLKFPDGSEVLYELTRKPVKNINLRVKEDGSLRISASPRVSVKRVEEFIVSEQAFIRRAQQRISEREEHSEIRTDIFRWLGGEYPVRVISSSREAAVLEQVGQGRKDEQHAEQSVVVRREDACQHDAEEHARHLLERIAESTPEESFCRLVFE